MGALFRFLFLSFLAWTVCYFFYSLGKRKALEGRKRNPRNKHRKRKFVKSSVVEKENDSK